MKDRFSLAQIVGIVLIVFATGAAGACASFVAAHLYSDHLLVDAARANGQAQAAAQAQQAQPQPSKPQ